MPTKNIQLREFCMARSGDKGGIVDISVFAPTQQIYEVLRGQITEDRVGKFFSGMADGPLTRYEMPNLRALHFVLEGALDGGASSSLRTDNLGKTYGANLLRLSVDIDPSLLKGVPDLCHPDSRAAMVG